MNIAGRKWPLLIFFLLSFFLPASAKESKLDSLFQVLHTAKEDTNRVNTLNAIAMEFRNVNPDTAIIICTEALRLSEKNNFEKGKGYSNYALGVCHYIKGDTLALGCYTKALEIWENLLSSGAKISVTEIKIFKCKTICNIGNVYLSYGDSPIALDHYLKALKLAEELNNKSEIARDLGNIGVVYNNQGDYSKTLEYYLKALKMKESLGNKAEIAITSGNIGIVYFRQGDYPKALEYYFKAFAIDSAGDNKNNMAAWLNDIGSVYNTLHEYPRALDIYLRALKIAEGTGNKKLVADNLGNIGSIYAVQKDYDKALEQFFKALQIAKEIENKNLIAINLGNIGSVYSLIKKFKPAEDYLTQAVALDKSIGALDYIMEFENALSNVYSQTGRAQIAFEHYKKYIAAKDSLSNEENTKKIVQLQMNYEFGQKETKMKEDQERKEFIYQEELKRQKLIWWSSAGIFVFILVFSLLLFNRARLKQKNLYQEQINRQQKEQAVAIMQIQEQERKRIAEDIHDSLGHLLSTAKLNLQAVPEGEKQHYANTLQLLDQASIEIRNISFNLMPQTLEEEGLVPALYELADKIRKSDLYDIMLQVHNMDDFQLDEQTKFNIYRIVQEAVNNILKHANAKEINIQLIRQEDHLSIMIEDDGKGFDTELVKRMGRGLRNITARSEWLHGTITIDSTPGRGTTIAIEIPVNSKK